MWATNSEKDLLNQSINLKGTEIDRERKDLLNLVLNQNIVERSE